MNYDKLFDNISYAIKDENFEGLDDKNDFKLNVVNIGFNLRRFYVTDKYTSVPALCFDVDKLNDSIIIKEVYDKLAYCSLFRWAKENNIIIVDFEVRLDSATIKRLRDKIAVFRVLDDYKEDDIKEILLYFGKEITKFSNGNVFCLMGRVYSFISDIEDMFFIKTGNNLANKIEKIAITNLTKEELINFLYDVIYLR
jgi:hypothetical protein